MPDLIIPVRIQRKRTKGYKHPPNTIYCGRDSQSLGPWGNEWPTAWQFAAWWQRNSDTYHHPVLGYEFPELTDPRWVRMWRNLNTLSGRPLSCWCPLDRPCHVDVLIEAFRRKFPEAVELKGGE